MSNNRNETTTETKREHLILYVVFLVLLIFFGLKIGTASNEDADIAWVWYLVFTILIIALCAMVGVKINLETKRDNIDIINKEIQKTISELKKE